MKFQKTILIMVSMFVLFSMLLVSCAPAVTETAAPPPEEVEEPEYFKGKRKK